MSLRASYNTGFRAPTPGQQGTTNVSTRLPNGFPVAVGLFPASGTVAQTLGATDLKPETSSGFSVGVTGSVGSADFTIDYYTIDVDDYFNAVSTRDVSSDPTAGDAYSNFLALDAAGVAGANTIGGVNWFTNAYDVGVSGVDAVVTLPIDSDLGTTDITLTYGYNKFEFNSSPDGFLNAEAQHDIANFDPNTRFILQANHKIDNIGVNLRGSYWGEGSNRASSSDDSAIQTFGSIFMTDLSLSYFGDGYTISAGGMNIFDEYPDKDSISDYCCGRIYPSASGISWQGGRWYVKAEYLF
jgi:iron complex outermembrane receptor protein